MKTCTSCLTPKALDDFYPHPRNTDGRVQPCIECRKAQSRAYYAANRERARLQQKKHIQENYETYIARERKRGQRKKEQKKLYGKQYYQKNKQRISEKQNLYRTIHAKQIKIYRKQYHLQNKEKIIRYVKEWNRNHPELVRAYAKVSRKKHADLLRELTQRRRARLRNAFVEPVHRMMIAERDHWICHICKKQVTKDTMSIDHLVPLSKGGIHAPINVALAHTRCNAQRGAGWLPAQLRLLP